MTIQIGTSACDTALQRVWDAHTDYNKALAASKLSDREALYTLIAAAYVAGKEFISPANRAWFVAAMSARGIELPTKGKKQNGWLKVIYLALGTWTTNAAGEKVWDNGDFGWRRYARALRHMNHVNVDPAKALDYIKAHTLDWMIEEDRKVNPPIKRNPTGVTNESAASVTRTAPVAVVAVEKPAEVGSTGTSDVDFGKAFGYWKGGQFCIVGFEPDSGAAALKLSVKKAKEATTSTSQTAAQVTASKALSTLDF